MLTAPSPIEVAAPCRIDLAGGTLDVYPLYLFEEDGRTLNMAISITSTARIVPREDGRVLLRSEDLDAEAQYPDVDHVSPDGPLGLVARAVRCYPPPCGVTVTVHSEAPHGSGLGASSALLMAVSVGLTHLRGETPSLRDLIDVGANLEAQTIGIPTGKQDYYPALYGGVAVLQFGVREASRWELCPSAAARAHLEQHLVLAFTGISHFSGANNWEILRNYMDGNMLTREALHRIGTTARKVEHCLRTETWELLPELLAEEWANRRTLGEGVSTPRVEHLMATAHAAGGEASKLCGAGGGGCMVTYVQPERRSAVEQALQEAGADVLPFRIATEGAQVREAVAG